MVRKLIGSFAIIFVVAGCGGDTSTPVEQQQVSNADIPIDNTIPDQDEPLVSASSVNPVAGTTVTSAPKPPPPTAFERLCEAYTSGNGEAWSAAEQELLEQGAEATSSLVAALEKGAAHERELAASLLAQIGSITPDARTVLVAALNDESMFVRSNAAATLCAIQDPSPELIGTLRVLMQQEDKDNRVMAASSAANLGERAAELLPELTGLLDAPEAAVRIAAAEALGRLGKVAQSAVEKLEALITDDVDDAVRSSVNKAIAAIRGETPKSGGVIIPASSSKTTDSDQ